MIVINMSLIDEENDREQFEALFEKYKYKVYSIALHILKRDSAAEDAASETFLYIAKNFSKIKELDKHKLDRYITIVSRNIAIDIHRREKKHARLQELPDDVFSDNSLREYERVLLKSVVSALSLEDQEILYLRYSLDLEHTAIAKSLGISKAAARKRLERAKGHLKKKLEGGTL